MSVPSGSRAGARSLPLSSLRACAALGATNSSLGARHSSGAVIVDHTNGAPMEWRAPSTMMSSRAQRGSFALAAPDGTLTGDARSTVCATRKRLKSNANDAVTQMTQVFRPILECPDALMAATARRRPRPQEAARGPGGQPLDSKEHRPHRPHRPRDSGGSCCSRSRERCPWTHHMFLPLTRADQSQSLMFLSARGAGGEDPMNDLSRSVKRIRAWMRLLRSRRL